MIAVLAAWTTASAIATGPPSAVTLSKSALCATRKAWVADCSALPVVSRIGASLLAASGPPASASANAWPVARNA